MPKFSQDLWLRVFSLSLVFFFFTSFLFYCQITQWANKNETSQVSVLSLSATTLVFICPEEPLEKKELQISCHDYNKALKDGPSVHIVGLGLKQEVISSSAHPCHIIEAPHVLDSKAYLIRKILGKEKQNKILYWNIRLNVWSGVCVLNQVK